MTSRKEPVPRAAPSDEINTIAYAVSFLRAATKLSGPRWEDNNPLVIPFYMLIGFSIENGFKAILESHFVTSMTAPIASGWSDIAGWGLHPLESAAFARRTPIADIRRGCSHSIGKPHTVQRACPLGRIILSAKRCQECKV